MYNKILLTIDGSEMSQKVIDWAKQTYAILPQAEFTFLYVHEPFLTVHPTASFAPVTLVDDSIPEVTPAQEACQAFEQQDRIHQKTRVGASADQIEKELKEGGYDLVVLGSQGHGMVASVVLGSTSAKILHHSPCSVLVIR